MSLAESIRNYKPAGQQEQNDKEQMLHFNLNFLAEADENEELTVREEKNSAVKWWTFEEALKASSEPWMTEHVYKKLIERTGEEKGENYAEDRIV